MNPYSYKYGNKPDFIDEIEIASDSARSENGSYFEALLTVGSEKYLVRVASSIPGSINVRELGEKLISTMKQE